MAVECAGVVSGRRESWEIQMHHNGLEEKVRRKSLSAELDELDSFVMTTAERASRSRVLRAAGCGRLRGREAGPRAAHDGCSGQRHDNVASESRARGRHDPAVPCRDEMIIASLS